MRIRAITSALPLALAACAGADSGHPCAPLETCSAGTRASPQAIALVDIDRAGDAFDLIGDDIRIGQLYAPIGEAADAALVRAGASVDDCDDCAQPRFRAVAVHPPRAAPLIAAGPVEGPLPRATAQRTHVEPGETWAREIAVDLDGDGAPDVEHVVRCDHYLPSGCHARACDRICRGTRAVGASEPRAVACRGFIPDLEDCN